MPPTARFTDRLLEVLRATSEGWPSCSLCGDRLFFWVSAWVCPRCDGLR
jgi:hypothetical protein